MRYALLSRVGRHVPASLPGQRYAGFPMPEWEYISISLNDLPLKPGVIGVLSDAGKDGWELVTITPNNIAYLKRPLATHAAPKTRSAKMKPLHEKPR
jgi:hypothetical protein